MTTEHLAYGVLVGIIALQRLVELRISAKHQRALIAAGGYEVAAEQMPWMRMLHGLWLFACVGEVLLMARDPQLWLVLLCATALVLGQSLRWAAIETLGSRWTVTIMILPEAPPKAGGLYRYLRHPNYLGVILEIAALPLLGGAWLTALIFTLLNAALLRLRIAREEAALQTAGGYQEALGNRGRFLPRPW